MAAYNYSNQNFNGFTYLRIRRKKTQQITKK